MIPSFQFHAGRGSSLADRPGRWGRLAAAGLALLLPAVPLCATAEPAVLQVSVDRGHPWRPPFGIERVGAPLHARVTLTGKPDGDRAYWVDAYAAGQLAGSHALEFTGEGTTWWAAVKLVGVPDEVRVMARDKAGGAPVELLLQPVVAPALEAEAVARSDRAVNPVDLGAILVPEDWILLGGGQSAVVEVAALSRSQSLPGLRMRARMGDGEPVEVGFPLQRDQRATRKVGVPCRSRAARETLRVSLVDGDRTLWEKEIAVMVVAEAPRWPVFGAVETKLRYDPPISVIDSSTGAKLPPLDYDTAWKPELNDVVVFLPNGSRFVFWRGTNYVPFWAGSHNTGVCYQWGENLSIPIHHPDGTRDFPEPLYDFELRYGSVEIIESTPSRVHVRWTYQATDVHYNIWGDQVREDFYFYPDGFGTRALTIASKPGSRYQLSEFLILTPQASYPLEVLPGHIADVLFLDGGKVSLRTPFEKVIDPATGKQRREWPTSRDQAAVFRIFAHRDDPAAAIYFHPDDKAMALFSFTGLYDRGGLVSPVYWGSHWPLGRGKITGWSVDDRIYESPAHNAIGGWLPNSDGKGGWGNWEVRPFESGQFPMLDTLGRAKVMDFNRWSWLIAKTEASDEALLNWARSYSAPPTVELTGAAVALPSYAPERRAIRLAARSPTVVVRIRPSSCTVNPVIEIADVPGDLRQVSLDGRVLPAAEYAWDGATFWLNAFIDAGGASLELQFEASGRP